MHFLTQIRVLYLCVSCPTIETITVFRDRKWSIPTEGADFSAIISLTLHYRMIILVLLIRMMCWQFWIIFIRLRKSGCGIMYTPSGLLCMVLAESTQRGCSFVIEDKADPTPTEPNTTAETSRRLCSGRQFLALGDKYADNSVRK